MLPLTRSRNRARFFGIPFSPSSLFAAGEQGAWYDPSDFTTMFNDAAGTQPITSFTSNQPVGLLLDKSKGLVLGPELIVNPDFTTDTWWVKDAGVTISGGTANWAATAATFQVYKTGVLTVGKYYEVTFTITSISSGGLRANIGGNLGVVRNAPGTYTERLTATTSGTVGVYSSGASTTASVDNVTVKEVTGNHATASGSARPVLSKRYNLLTRTEEFDDGAWLKFGVTVIANAAAAPNGTTTAEKLYVSSSGNSRSLYRGGFPSVSKTHSIYAKAAEKSLLCFYKEDSSTGGAWFDLANGVLGTVASGITASITSLGGGWYRCTITSTASFNQYTALGPADADNSIATVASGTDGIYIWGADLRRTIDANAFQPAYQRVVTATDYDGDGFLPYLEYSGAQAMATGSINFTATDKMTVFAGVTRLSDAADGMLCELSNNAGSNSGAFYFTAPESGASLSYSFLARGTVFSGGPQRASTPLATYPAPITNVLSATGNIAGDLNTIRVNGGAGTSATGDQGTGNYGTYPLYIGARNLGSVFFNGRLYSLITRGAQSSAAQISATESWVAGKTGVSL